MTLPINKRILRRTVPENLPGTTPQTQPGPLRGFTLVELLIVIVIIGILAGLLLPALARSKARAQAVVCRNNKRQLTFAWIMYAGDNNDRLVYNLGGNISGRGIAPSGLPNWVDNMMDWTTNSDNTNTSFAATSLLAPYANYSAAIYKCPADRALSDEQRRAGFTARVRSVSMNAMVGDPGSLLNAGQNINNPGYKQFLKESEIPSSSQIFVFLDEHPDSINDGYFINTWKGQLADSSTSDDNDYYEWTDLPGSYHDGAGSFSFADGHAEIHQWRYDSTKPPSVAGLTVVPEFIQLPDQPGDLYWVLRRMSILTGN